MSCDAKRLAERSKHAAMWKRWALLLACLEQQRPMPNTRQQQLHCLSKGWSSRRLVGPGTMQLGTLEAARCQPCRCRG